VSILGIPADDFESRLLLLRAACTNASVIIIDIDIDINVIFLGPPAQSHMREN